MGMRMPRMKILASLLLYCAAWSAHAALIDDINRLRTKGCDKQVAASRLKQNSELDAVAQVWSDGRRLAAALKQANYPAINSASMRVEGTRDDAMIVKVLAQRYCETITGRDFTEIGMFRDGATVWIVVASRYFPPAPKDMAQIGEDALALVNAARAKPRRCGTTEFEAVPPLTMSQELARAALIHARDMATNEHFEHEGTDGSKPSDRISRVGYDWRTAAENIALGPVDAQQVVDGWLASPGHCANIMNPRSTQMGLAYAVNKNRDVYWAQEFASPR